MMKAVSIERSTRIKLLLKIFKTFSKLFYLFFKWRSETISLGKFIHQTKVNYFKLDKFIEINHNW